MKIHIDIYDAENGENVMSARGDSEKVCQEEYDKFLLKLHNLLTSTDIFKRT